MNIAETSAPVLYFSNAENPKTAKIFLKPVIVLMESQFIQRFEKKSRFQK
jgi:hypothetical protein